MRILAIMFEEDMNGCRLCVYDEERFEGTEYGWKGNPALPTLDLFSFHIERAGKKKMSYFLIFS